ncbi:MULTISPECIES: energy-converting hydrogenase B subunit EhbP [Bacillus]|uniref:energy-converting hydrogenase B subunit EhbP n=1 Tax=Bacillus TaxID=1386 RepID=UPI000BB777EE|nr:MULTISPECIES: energy-converting hydrogenase B subunit EhbP [Bacillus]
MKKILIKLKVSLLTLLLLLLLPSTLVLAASYDLLKPEEVEKRAHFIVRGTYDFKADSISGGHMYRGFEFMVKEVIYGDVETGRMIIGLQVYDDGWVKEHQEQGGEFLLFAEKHDLNEFYVPVLGTNGLIPILDGKVLDEDKKRATYFEKFMDGNKGENTQLYVIVATIIVFVLIVVVKKRKPHLSRE